MNLMLYIADDAEVWAGIVHRAIIGFSFLAIVFICVHLINWHNRHSEIRSLFQRN